jgi:hypothetical protein
MEKSAAQPAEMEKSVAQPVEMEKSVAFWLKLKLRHNVFGTADYKIHGESFH